MGWAFTGVTLPRLSTVRAGLEVVRLRELTLVFILSLLAAWQVEKEKGRREKNAKAKRQREPFPSLPPTPFLDLPPLRSNNFTLTLFRSCVTGEKREGGRKTRKRQGIGSHFPLFPRLPWSPTPFEALVFILKHNFVVAWQVKKGKRGGEKNAKATRDREPFPFLPPTPLISHPSRSNSFYTKTQFRSRVTGEKREGRGGGEVAGKSVREKRKREPFPFLPNLPALIPPWQVKKGKGGGGEKNAKATRDREPFPSLPPTPLISHPFRSNSFYTKTQFRSRVTGEKREGRGGGEVAGKSVREKREREPFPFLPNLPVLISGFSSSFLPLITSFSSAFFLIGILKLLLSITRVNVNVPWTFHHTKPFLSRAGSLLAAQTTPPPRTSVDCTCFTCTCHVSVQQRLTIGSFTPCLTAADHEPSFSLESVVWQQWWCPLCFFWRFSEFLRLILVG